MSHVLQETLLNVLFNDGALSASQEEHLASCSTCQEESALLTELSDTFAVAQRSTPSSEQLDKYAQFANEIQVTPVLAEMWNKVKMTLTLDSREQAAQMGLRSGGSQSYRLLFSSDLLDVELMIESDGKRRRLEGEVLAVDSAKISSPSLIELFGLESSPDWMSTESNGQGRFSVPQVDPGQYDMVITPAFGPLIALEGLAIT